MCAAALLVSSGSAKFQGLPKVRSFSNAEPPQFLENGSEDGPDRDTCWGYFWNLARDAFTDQCEFTEDPVANCELDCYRDAANMWRALDLAGCPSDLFSCMHDDRCNSESLDEGETCHEISGRCIVECSNDDGCNTDYGEFCYMGRCVYGEGDLDPPSFARYAAQSFDPCASRDDGVPCQQVWYQGWDFEQDPSQDVCDQFESWGCCMRIVDTYVPGFTSKCPGYEPVEACELEWEGDYTSAFCANCGSDAMDDGDCGVISGLLCQIGMGDKLSYCQNPACANYGQPGNDDEACVAATVALADGMCSDDSSSSSDSSDDGPNCRDCSAYDRRRRLNFGGMPCC